MSERDSESEPFQSSGSEYVPTEIGEPGTSRGKRKTKVRVRKHTEKVKNEKKGRKRPRCESKWKRNIRKVLNASGEEYLNTVKKVVPKRVIGRDCACQRRCFLNVPQQLRESILETFNKLADRAKQDLYLGGLISSNQIARKRQRTAERTGKSVSHTYKVSKTLNLLIIRTSSKSVDFSYFAREVSRFSFCRYALARKNIKFAGKLLWPFTE